jgi:NAD(P)-dependent dehydrogenase (short-subunit alcohol dehydrogenase family)
VGIVAPMSAPMIEAGNGGSTITISSAAGIKAVPGCVHYCASKSGVVGLTNSLAVELGEFGIRVNSVHPYGTDSRWATTCRCTRCSRTIPTTSTVSRRARCRPIPLADPDLISDIVVWLARDASSLVTAAQIPADKGYLEI